MLLLENEYVKLSLDENVPCIEWVGKKFMPSGVFRESEEKCLEYYHKFKEMYAKLQWFVDAREIGSVSPEDQQWVVENILPKFASAGLQKEVFVVPESALGKMVIKNYIAKAGEIIAMNVFDNVGAAKKWLGG